MIIKDPVIYKYFGDAAQLVCQLPLNLDAQVAWLRDGDVLRADENYVMAVLPSNQHVLTVQRLGKKDFGEYVCRATNDLGSARGSAYIRGSLTSCPSLHLLCPLSFHCLSPFASFFFLSFFPFLSLSLISPLPPFLLSLTPPFFSLRFRLCYMREDFHRAHFSLR